MPENTTPETATTPAPRVALVTGGTAGIGAAIAEALHAAGYRVAVNFGSHAAAADKFASRTGLPVYSWNVADFDACADGVARVQAAMGPIDVLVNNAGGLVQRVPIADFTDALFDEIMHINALSMLAFCREVVPLMRQQGTGGAIINVTSVAARHGGGPGAYLYAGSKGFVSTATRGLAKELVGDHIRVNAVAPGNNIRSSGTAQYGEAMLDLARKATPLKRLGTPVEVARVIVFLASSFNDFVTGSVYQVDGGQALWGDIWTIDEPPAPAET